MVETKPPRYPEGNELRTSTEEHKGKSPDARKFHGNTTPKKTQGPELDAKTNFKARCINLEGYIYFDLGIRASDKFSGTTKDLERYIEVPTVISFNYPSFPIHSQPCPNQRFQKLPLTQVTNIPIRTENWYTSKNIILKRLSSKN